VKLLGQKTLRQDPLVRLKPAGHEVLTHLELTSSKDLPQLTLVHFPSTLEKFLGHCLMQTPLELEVSTGQVLGRQTPSERNSPLAHLGREQAPLLQVVPVGQVALKQSSPF
jgi:hypothetical protein